jgi:release factor glutamine methyltransferase
MRALFRHVWLPFYRRWALRHIERSQTYLYEGLQLHVPPGVFHPGVFFSSPIFISFLKTADFQGKKILDVGTGSGLLALFSAQKGGITTALDINPQAVETARENARTNNLDLKVLESDLFDQLAPQPFDFILINPPYYPRSPHNFAEHAFFAGENLEYFEKLFAQLHDYILPNTAPESEAPPTTHIWMILSEDCHFFEIQEIAARNSFYLHSVFEKKKWGERFFVARAHQV